MADNDDYMVAKAYDDTITELMWDRLQEAVNANRRFRLRGVAGGNDMRYSSTKVVWDSDIYIYFTRESDGAWVYNKINTNPTTGITCGDDDLLYVTLNDTTATVLTVTAADYTSMLTDDTGRVLILGAVRGSRWYGTSSTDISHDSILDVSINDHHARDHNNTEHSTNYEAANANIQSHVGGTPPTDSHHAQLHDNTYHSTNYATAADLTSHTGASNPHSGSASDSELSTHMSDVSTHNKTTIAGMEDLHAQGHSHDSHSGVLSADEGGTGQSVYVIGDILYADTTTSLAKLIAATSGYVLTSSGTGSAPTWESPGAPSGHALDSAAHSDVDAITDAKGAMLWQAASGTWSRLTPAATVGHTLRCSNADGAIGFAQLAHSDLSGDGTNAHSVIDTHLSAGNPHSGSQPLDAQLTSLAGFTAGEITQLSNIGTSTISSGQWGIVGGLVAIGSGTIISVTERTALHTKYAITEDSGSDVTFNKVITTANIDVGYTINFAGGSIYYVNSSGVLHVNAISAASGTSFNDIDMTMQASPTHDQLLTALAIKNYVAGTGPLKPYKNLETYDTNTASSKRATLLYEDDYAQGYLSADKPAFFSIDSRSGIEDSNDYFRIITSGMPASGPSQCLAWYSTGDIIETIFKPPPGVMPNQMVIEFENFYYDDIGGADRFFISINVMAWDNSASKYVSRMIMQLKGEHNIYYVLSNGVNVNTGWGNPETLGWHTLKFFISWTTNLGNRVRCRYECSGKSAVLGTMQNYWDDDNDYPSGPTAFMLISPTLSTGWDIKAYLGKIKVYWRDNSDI